MNLVARQDRVLLGGLAVAMVVVFAKPIRYLLDLARDVERSSGLALVPALIILTVVFVLHLQGRRQEAKGRAAAAEAEALQSGTRASEMERLVTFGHALGRSLDRDAIRDVVAANTCRSWRQPTTSWVLLRADGRWQALGGAARDSQREVERTRELIADRAFITEGSWKADAIAAEGHLCLPLTAGGHQVGVLGIPDSAGPFTDGRQRVLAMAGALLAISLRNAQLFHDVRENSLRDGLTGCFNRTHALAVIDMELRRARRSRLPVSLIMLDIDHFKDGERPLRPSLRRRGARRRRREDARRAARQRPEVPVRRRRVPRAACLKRRSKARSASPTRCAASSRRCRSPGRASWCRSRQALASPSRIPPRSTARR